MPEPNALKTFLGSGYWIKARAAMDGEDNRVLVIGPGPASQLDGCTTYVHELLRTHGFTPIDAPRHGTSRERLVSSAKYPFIVALVRTVGTASETLLMLQHISRAAVGVQVPGIVVVVPSEHRDAHFAFTVKSHFGADLAHCDRMDYSDDALGAMVLEELAILVLVRGGENDSGRKRDAVEVAADDNGRRARGEGTELVPQPAVDLRLAYFLVGSAVVFLLTVAGVWKWLGVAAGAASAVAIMLLLAVATVVLSQLGRLKSDAVERLFKSILGSLPLRKGRGDAGVSGSADDGEKGDDTAG